MIMFFESASHAVESIMIKHFTFIRILYLCSTQVWEGRSAIEQSDRERILELMRVGEEGRTSWKVIEGHGKSWNLMEGSVLVTKYDLEVTRNF